MKVKKIIVAITLLLGLCGCKVGNVSQSTGLSDQSYLLFVSNSSYGEVNVQVDKATRFDPKVVKSKKSNFKGNAYAVSTGKRHITVSHKGNIVYDRTIFISVQETKKIMLP